MLTRAEIAAMTAPQLRLAVAEYVMGHEWHDGYNSEYDYLYAEPFHYGAIREKATGEIKIYSLPDYTEDIAAADLVVAAMEAKGYRVTVSAYPGALDIKTCTMKRTDDKKPFVATAATRAEAISRCAMYATVVESEKE